MGLRLPVSREDSLVVRGDKDVSLRVAGILEHLFFDGKSWISYSLDPKVFKRGVKRVLKRHLS